ncbi:vesicle-associated membrane protein 5 [Oryzias melastigma]|uniref:Vesicle-associated membrane protein 5 n=1 Tax=Oryzias melastigma TaxID=30732 RepID=A0A3B3CTV0_ORYME|nr:vesicle-associated membrane protein 5 [Oryzias melastigma]
MENGKSKLQQMQDDAEEVKVIMLDNLQKADERREKMSNLEDRADDLLEQSKQFEKKTNTLRQQKWWENKRAKVFLGIGVAAGLVILGLIILVSVL